MFTSHTSSVVRRSVASLSIADQTEVEGRRGFLLRHSLSRECLVRLVKSGRGVEWKGRYIHFDSSFQIRHLHLHLQLLLLPSGSGRKLQFCNYIQDETFKRKWRPQQRRQTPPQAESCNSIPSVTLSTASLSAAKPPAMALTRLPRKLFLKSQLRARRTSMMLSLLDDRRSNLGPRRRLRRGRRL